MCSRSPRSPPPRWSPAHGRTELDRLNDIDAAVKVLGEEVYVVGYQGRAAMLALDSGQVWWTREVSSYRGVDVARTAQPGSLDEFLVERYRLFTARDGVVSRLEIDHAPWQLRRAEAEIHANTMTQVAGIVLPLQPPMIHFVDRQDVRTGVPVRVT